MGAMGDRVVRSFLCHGSIAGMARSYGGVGGVAGMAQKDSWLRGPARQSPVTRWVLLVVLEKIRSSRTIGYMNIIADTNIFLAVVLDEPEKQLIIALTSESDAVSPKILPYEIGNALSAMIKRKQLTRRKH